MLIVVEGDQKAPFSIATTPRCRGVLLLSLDCSTLPLIRTLVGIVFANWLWHLGSIPGWIIRKTFKMVLDTSLLNTRQYKVRIKGKVEQSRERSSATLHFGVVAIEKGAFWSPSSTVTNLLTLLMLNWDVWNRTVNLYKNGFGV